MAKRPTPPARRGRTRAVDVEAVLLDAAHRLLESEGVEALTVRRVATEAGVAPMGIYHRFGGKDGLAEALFVDGNRLLTEAMQQVEVGDALGELREGCRQYRRFALANPGLYSLIFERAMPGFEPSPAALETCMKTFGVLVDCVRRAQAAGVLRSGEAFGYAHRIWSACHGAVSLELRQIGFMEDLDAQYEGLISTLVDGLTPVGSDRP